MLNLISDPWIPVRRRDGSRAVIAPWQMADLDLDFPDWPRPDLNIACLELLIGLVLLADPPRDLADWRTGRSPQRLRDALTPHAPAFDLMGEGARFMQDRVPLEQDGTANSPDMLFIDSAGGQTARNNADLTVKRDRYPVLDPAMAAMALFTLQSQAPSGGAGNRTSMRGGGPLITLVDPGGGLWPLIWANVPHGDPAPTDALPWMRRTRTSEQGQVIQPHDTHPVEAFFGMPRRLRLVAGQGGITGVVQKPYGTNYGLWEHPLTPYYRVKPGTDLLPRHPRAGAFGYRNWLGITVQRVRADDDTARRAQVLDLWAERGAGEVADIIVAGWAMDNMKPRDFTWSRAPLVPDDLADMIEGMVAAADALAVVLRAALAPVLAEGETREVAREAFYHQTQADFERHVARLTAVNWPAVARDWLADLGRVALALFDAAALPGLPERDIHDQAQIVAARRNLTAALAGYGKLGAQAHVALGLTPPEQGRKKGKAA